MGVYHRDYMREEPGGPRGGAVGGPATWSVLTWLLIINAVVYVLQYAVLAPGNPPPGWSPGGDLSWAGLKEGRVYQLVTHMFVHGSLMHLLFNGLGIYFIGRMLLQFLSTKHFLMVYFGSGLLGGVMQLAFTNLVEGHDVNLVGASGCVYGLLCALATLIPNQVLTFLLFFVLPIRARMKTFASVFVIVSMLLVAYNLLVPETAASSDRPRVGHMAHLGGSLFGWFFIAYIYPRLGRKQNDQARQQRWNQRFGTKSVVDADYTDSAAARERDRELKLRRKEREARRNVSAEVDAILDKINEHGFQSLTEAERKILDASSDKLG